MKKQTLPKKSSLKSASESKKPCKPTVEPKKEPKLSEVALVLWKNYMDKSIVDDFSKVPTFVKLTWLQNIPPAFIRTRPLNKTVLCPYIPHEFAEKALNFAFNFQVSCEVISKDGREGTTKSGKKFFECEIEAKFTFKDGDREIIKTVFAGHKGFENDAATRADVYKSAVSKAYTVVARQFGIASNVKDYNVKSAPAQSFSEMEEKAYQEASKSEEEPVIQGAKTKSWMDK